MPVYLGPGAAEFARAQPHTRWLWTAPVNGRPAYPVALDLAESARAASDSAAISAAAAALAPTWEVLDGLNLTGHTSAFVGGAADEGLRLHLDTADPSLARYLVEGLSRAVTALGSSHGAVLVNPHRYDPVSLFFATRLVRDAERTGFHIALVAPARIREEPRFAHLLSRADVRLFSGRRVLPAVARDEPAVRLLAACPQGLPLRTLSELAPVSPHLGPFVSTGPAAEPWISLPRAHRRAIKQRLSSGEWRELHARIFDATVPAGWGYLRRGVHAGASRDLERLRRQHTAYTIGMLTPAPAAVFRHLAAIGEDIDQLDRIDASRFLVTAARLGVSIGAPRTLRLADKYCRKALTLAEDPATRILIVTELANLNAIQRDGEALQQSEQWCRAGLAMLECLEDPGVKARSEIRLLNIHGLVAYHRGDNELALSIEREAQAVASRIAPLHGDVERWAMPLLSRNIAKVLERRFADAASAILLLESNLVCDQSPVTRTADIMKLAQLYFDQHEHHRVVDLLCAQYETGHPASFDQESELLGRVIFALSLLALGDVGRAKRQLVPLETLSRTIDTPGAYSLVATIRERTEQQRVE